MRIGWIGLGAMRTPMATRLHNAGLNVSVYNRTESKAVAFKEKGLTVYTTPLDLAKQVDLAFIMLSDKSAIDAVLTSDFWEQMTGKIVVNMSTIAPSESLALGKIAEQYRVTYLEAPVSGSVGAAQAGALLILVAGNEAVVSELKPIFAHLGSQTFYLGQLGQGTGTKLSINALLAQMGVAYSEALLLAKELGVNQEQFGQVVSQSGMNSPLFQAKKDMWLRSAYPAAFSLKLMAKDVRLAKNELGEYSELPFLFQAEELYSRAERAGLGESDMAAVYDYLEKRED
ncbi:NAD(P)-dependent oxidoreductase [Streptococcus mutans]|jgi:3-hydroxyisobutyrate dehydrogenase and related beta-hydroxyacid dehydrogenases|uniref:NAD(P)-dependent oxidoreductase n=1 Tax=Streptococcus mutans TaxID=1309 RepID=UPI0002B52C78|nr:NAD(P)-dependent oxidoreductase [Streptococcus mutans]EMC03541.1 putative 3-hydroxyacid dehydrogenase [Streptococcus mutans NFSM1]MCB4948399.1 NAD(P)-dependent oxidoreductase [Streptococcus mutans]MCB4960397.1 NAD(P)-dependent oxidoreductase [Streptococcus mutans]MCB5001566.1 NAD(P)-dependent oxidoreductase [Streptococcus mutans]MCB5078082.1 NAD(P)-dependent oxidoreductase [Streptococcus mutans]